MFTSLVTDKQTNRLRLRILYLSLPVWHSRDIHELSYRKQIARQLRTQFIEGISLTLKSTLRVTQSHWKWNHWIDHTRLSSRVIGRWILSWPWNEDQGHSRSLKLVLFESLGAASYSPSIVTMAVSVAVCEIFSVQQWCDLENRVRVRPSSLEMAPFDRSHTSSY